LRAMGMLAAQTVLEQIGLGDGGNHVQEIMVDPELVVRESTCSPAGGKR